MMNGASILLVDDEVRILQVFSTQLRDMGHTVRTAARADEALRLVAEERFDIAFIDQFLGRARGLEVMRQMSAIRPDLYFVIITGNGSTDLAVDALKQGASDFIMKPFLNADLVRSIEYVDRKRELDRQKKDLVTTLERKIREKTEELKDVYLSVLASLTQAMEKRDTGTFGHSRRVSYYARLIAAALDIGAEERNSLKEAALLHDIGKIGTSDLILGKQGPLTDGEKEIVRTHPQRGVEILKPLARSFKRFEAILPAILHHHEHYDGSGYPLGLAGEGIPLLARIIAVADTYDAILSARPYRSASNHRQAIFELVRCAGKQFDPRIVNAFVGMETRYNQLVGALPTDV